MKASGSQSYPGMLRSARLSADLRNVDLVLTFSITRSFTSCSFD